MPTAPLPDRILTEQQLENVLTTPDEALVAAIGALKSPLVVLGAAGKMGPTLCRLAKRAADQAGHDLDVLAVSRFSDPSVRDDLEAHGVRTARADALNPADLHALPDSENVVYLIGMKFGTSNDPSMTWAVNTLAPAYAAERYRAARIVALSTGNVYPLAPVSAGGSRETDPLTPLGEYANAAVARERILEHASKSHDIPICVIRLSYALDLRYGVVHDLAQRVWNGQPIPLANGHFNAIWQGDANALILRSFGLASAPPTAINLTSPAIHSVRDIATRLGALMGKAPQFEGEESGTAFVSNTRRMIERLGEPATPIDTVLRWTAEWLAQGGRSLGRPTHFETRDGIY